MSPKEENINTEHPDEGDTCSDEPRQKRAVWKKPEVKTLALKHTVGGSPGTVSESTSMAVGFASTS